MSDDRGAAGPTPNPGVTALMVVLGIILLLPGLCTVYFVAQTVATQDVVRLATRDPYFQLALVFWGVCLLISLAGALLLWHAHRRSQRHVS